MWRCTDRRFFFFAFAGKSFLHRANSWESTKPVVSLKFLPISTRFSTRRVVNWSSLHTHTHERAASEKSEKCFPSSLNENFCFSSLRRKTLSFRVFNFSAASSSSYTSSRQVQQETKRSEWKKLFSSSVFLFPRFNSALHRSSIVENGNVTEKGMAKKSWKHFHKQPSGGRTGERERAKRRICCCTSAEKGFVSFESRVEWGCFVVCMLSKQRFILTTCACICAVFYAYLINLV